MITIRKAGVTDWQAMRDLFWAFRADPLTPSWFGGDGVHPNSERLLVSTLAQGNSFISFKDETPIGFLLATKNHVLFTTNEIIEEIAWFVLEEHRGSRAGLELLKHWEELVDEQKAAGKIVGGILHTMVNSPIDLIRRGYQAADTTYMR